MLVSKKKKKISLEGTTITTNNEPDIARSPMLSVRILSLIRLRRWIKIMPSPRDALVNESSLSVFKKKFIWSFACLNSVRSVAFFIPTEFEFRLEISFALVWYCEGREFERARCLETHAPRTWPGVTGGWETRSGDTDVLSVYYF